MSRPSETPRARKPCSKNTPFPLFQPNPHPDTTPGPDTDPTPDPIPLLQPLIPPTQPDGDPRPMDRPPPSPARYPTSPRVVVKTGAGRAAEGLLDPPEGGLPGQSRLVKMDTECVLVYGRLCRLN